MNNNEYTLDFYLYIKIETILNKINHLSENILIKLKDRSILINDKFESKISGKQSVNKEHCSKFNEMYREVCSDEEKINKYYKDFDFDEVRRNMEIEFYFEGIREL